MTFLLTQSIHFIELALAFGHSSRKRNNTRNVHMLTREGVILFTPLIFMWRITNITQYNDCTHPRCIAQLTFDRACLTKASLYSFEIALPRSCVHKRARTIPVSSGDPGRILFLCARPAGFTSHVEAQCRLWTYDPIKKRKHKCYTFNTNIPVVCLY